MRVLFISPYCDGTDVSEPYTTYCWAERLSRHCDLTVLALSTSVTRIPLQSQLPYARVITWREPALLRRFPTINSTLQPAYIHFFKQVRNFLRHSQSIGGAFDVIHQMGPNSLRYPSPALGVGIPLIHGPMQGSIPTPEGFRAVVKSESWIRKLRTFDTLRLELDPWLRKSLRETNLVLVGAPYALKMLEKVDIKRVEVMNPLGIDGIVPRTTSNVGTTHLRMLHVGRVVRTKGVRECINALALLRDLPGAVLDIAGDGEDLANCRSLAGELGLDERVYFHGRLPRDGISELYSKADVLLFPSFREPLGAVVLEAMSFGLPVVTTTVGGPGYMVNDTCGFRLEARSPGQLTRDIAAVARILTTTPGLRRELSCGAYARALEIGSWKPKIDRMLGWYKEVCELPLRNSW